MIIDNLKKDFPNMPDLRARSIRVDKPQRKVFVTVSYPSLSSIDEIVKKNIVESVRKAIPKGYYGMVSFAEDKFSEVTFRKFVADLLKKRFPVYSVNKETTLVKIADKHIDVTFFVNEVDKRSMELAEFTTQLNAIFEEYTSYEVEVLLKADLSALPTVDFSDQERLVKLAINRELLRPSRVFKVENVEKCIGKLIDASPMYISDIRKPSDSCVICGKMQNRSLKSSKNNPNMWVCKFDLQDDSDAKISCIMFARLDVADMDTLRQTHADKTEEEIQKICSRKTASNDKKLRKMMALFDGMSVVVRGRIAYNDFSESLEMTVYDLCKCDILPISLQPDCLKPVPNEYSVIEPVAHKELRQLSFAEHVAGQNYLSGKSLVFLNVNSTGFELTKDKIFALSAVKVIDGHVKEELFTYLNPEASVDHALLSACEISEDKLVFCPTVSEIIADLYKFCFGCDIVGNNLAKTIKLINYYAAPVGYNFDNTQNSSQEMLSTLFDRSVFDKKPNCASISDVCKTLKIACPSDVFCKYAAMASASCACLLAENAK